MALILSRQKEFSVFPNYSDTSKAGWVFTPGHAVSITRSSCVTWRENPSHSESSAWSTKSSFIYMLKQRRNRTQPPWSTTTTFHRTVVGNLESRRIDASTRQPAVVSSDMQIQTLSIGQLTEVPLPAELDEMRQASQREGGVDGPRWTSDAAGT